MVIYTVKPIYKGHSREPENVPFIYRLKLYALLMNGQNEAALVDSDLLHMGDL